MPSAPRHQGGVAVGVHGALTGVSARHGGGGRNARSNAARTITIDDPDDDLREEDQETELVVRVLVSRLGCDRGRVPPHRRPGRGPAHGGVPGRAGGDARSSGPGDRRAPEVVRAAAVDVDQDVVGRRDLGEPGRRARIGPVGVGVEPTERASGTRDGSRPASRKGSRPTRRTHRTATRLRRRSPGECRSAQRMPVSTVRSTRIG